MEPSSNYQHPDTYDLQKCHLHRAANSYGMPLNYHKKCNCCGKLTEKERLTWNFPLVKIYYCGPQLVCYLLSVKYLTVLLFVLCFINAIPLMFINHQGKACEKKLQCSSSFLLPYTVFNQFGQRKKIATEAYIIFADYIICIAFCQFLRRKLRTVKKEIDEANLFPSQFAVFCTLPAENIKKKVAIQAIEKWWKLQIKYNKKQIKQLFPQILAQQAYTSRSQRHSSEQVTIPSSHLIEQIIFYQKEQLSKPNNIQTKKCQAKKEGQAKDAKNEEKQKSTSNSCWLILFKSKQYANYFYEKNSPSVFEKFTCFQKFRHVYINQKQLGLARQLYPCEINWQNNHMADRLILKQRLCSLATLLLLMGIGSALVFLLHYLYKKHVSKSLGNFHQTYYVLVAFITNVLVVVGNCLITLFSQKQQYSFYASQKAALVYKIVIFNLTLILITPIAVIASLDTQLLWKKNGLAETQSLTLIIYMFYHHIKRYISPNAIKIISGYNDLHKSKGLSQEEANLKCNRPPHYIEQEYASIITVLYLTFFLSSLLPSITILACISLLVHFWLQKANIAYFYNEDQPHSNMLNSKMIEVIQFSFSMMLFGNFTAYTISNSLFEQESNVLLIFLYTISFLYTLLSISLPHEKINAKLFSLCEGLDARDEPANQNQYQLAKSTFITLFENFNNEQKQSDSSSSDKQANAGEQLRSIEASLSLSLRERLIQRQAPIIRQMNSEQDEYFEYERKINMKKAQPKVAIPPLFKKDINLRKQIIIK